jgi:hypothetical protein
MPASWELAAAAASPAAHCITAIQAARAKPMYGVSAVPNAGRPAGGAARCALHGALRRAIWVMICSIHNCEQNQLFGSVGEACTAVVRRGCASRTVLFASSAGAYCNSDAARAGRPHSQPKAQVQRQEVLGLLILSWCPYLQSTHQSSAGLIYMAASCHAGSAFRSNEPTCT